MNLPWRGGVLLLALFFQDPTPPPPDLVARYAEILEKGPLNRREFAARALLTLGRPGYEAFKRSIVANPEIAKVVGIPEEPPRVALVRFPSIPASDKMWRGLLAMKSDSITVAHYPNEAEPILWEGLDSSDSIASGRARFVLRDFYKEEDLVQRGSINLIVELNRKRSFDVSDRSLPEILAAEPVSWILLAPRSDRTTLKLRNISLGDFLRIAAPDLAAIPFNDLLILVPSDRVAFAMPPSTVWASTDLAPRLESALRALARNETGPIKALTGVPVYHALRRSLGWSPDAAALAEDLRKQLQQRVYFLDRDDLKGPNINLEPKGRKTSEVLAEFESLAKRSVSVGSKDVLDQRAPDFNFRNIPAEQAARALEFRLNYLR